MRTTVDMPGSLLDEARAAANVRTKREAVIAGLEELIRKAKARNCSVGVAGWNWTWT